LQQGLLGPVPPGVVDDVARCLYEGDHPFEVPDDVLDDVDLAFVSALPDPLVVLEPARFPPPMGGRNRERFSIAPAFIHLGRQSWDEEP